MSQRIAIIGSGISGLTAAHILHPAHDITVYEKNSRIGGHSCTIDVELNGNIQPVDIGFIVFNKRNYPNLVKLFEYLDVPYEKSSMSFGATVGGGAFEYSSKNPNALFGQRSNIWNPTFWRLLKDIIWFNRHAKKVLKQQNNNQTLGAFLESIKVGEYFKRYYLLPMGASIWSTSLQDMLEFPLHTFLTFFDEHGLLTVFGHPQWYTVTGGSMAYVEILSAPFKERIRLDSAVTSIKRYMDRVEITDSQGNKETYDQLVFACHADEALAILGEEAVEEETRLLSSFGYSDNHVVLHQDAEILPTRQRCWASWMYDAAEDNPEGASHVSLHYWMNVLQNIPKETPLFVTLNPHTMPAEQSILHEAKFQHPIYSQSMVQAQTQMNRIQGVRRSWFAGAHLRYGFHEDGVMSAMHVCEHLGVRARWA